MNWITNNAAMLVRDNGSSTSQKKRIGPAPSILAMLPPALVVVLMQKWFVKGLVDTEK
jgi:sn-glycerol 3-phosphate transport system permease protein